MELPDPERGTLLYWILFALTVAIVHLSVDAALSGLCWLRASRPIPSERRVRKHAFRLLQRSTWTTSRRRSFPRWAWSKLARRPSSRSGRQARSLYPRGGSEPVYKNDQL